MPVETQQLKDAIRTQFGSGLNIYEKRPGILQITSPIYHEDGDAVEIYLREVSENIIRVSDYGMSVMRLSYTYELDTDRKRDILNKIIRENRAKIEEGVIFIDTQIQNLYPAVMQLAQVIAKVTNMKYFGRETIENLFYEMLEDHIFSSLRQFQPVKIVSPLPQFEVYEADYELHPNGKPYYLFGVKDSGKARLVTIACQQFTIAKIPFSSVVVHSDFEKLSSKDRKLLTNACDKQFTSLDDFVAEGERYLSRQSN